jgi:hypothetical protein
MPRKAAALLLRPMVPTISTAAVTIVPFTNLSLGAILADRGVVCQPARSHANKPAEPRPSNATCPVSADFDFKDDQNNFYNFYNFYTIFFKAPATSCSSRSCPCPFASSAAQAEHQLRVHVLSGARTLRNAALGCGPPFGQVLPGVKTAPAPAQAVYKAKCASAKCQYPLSTKTKTKMAVAVHSPVAEERSGSARMLWDLFLF